MLLLSLTSYSKSQATLETSFHFSTEMWLFPLILRALAPFRHKRLTPPDIFCHPSDDHPEFFFVIAFRIVNFFLTRDLDLSERHGDGDDDSDNLILQLEHKMALPNSENHRCLIGPQVSFRRHRHHCQAANQVDHPVPNQITAFKKKILWCVYSRIECPKNFLERLLTASSYFPKISPSFSRSLSSLVGAENHNTLTEPCTVFQGHVAGVTELLLLATIWSAPTPTRDRQGHRRRPN